MKVTFVSSPPAWVNLTSDMMRVALTSSSSTNLLISSAHLSEKIRNNELWLSEEDSRDRMCELIQCKHIYDTIIVYYPYHLHFMYKLFGIITIAITWGPIPSHDKVIIVRIRSGPVWLAVMRWNVLYFKILIHIASENRNWRTSWSFNLNTKNFLNIKHLHRHFFTLGVIAARIRAALHSPILW